MGATSLLLGATALNVGSTLIGADSQSRALRAQGDYQQQIAEINARTADLMAENSLERGKTEASLVKKRAQQLQGKQRVGYAGQGVDVNSGTALDVQDETYTMGETDALTVKNNAWMEAWGYKTQARNIRAEGRLKNMAARAQANNTLLTGGLSATGSLLSGGYQLYRG